MCSVGWARHRTRPGPSTSGLSAGEDTCPGLMPVLGVQSMVEQFQEYFFPAFKILLFTSIKFPQNVNIGSKMELLAYA